MKANFGWPLEKVRKWNISKNECQGTNLAWAVLEASVNPGMGPVYFMQKQVIFHSCYLDP